MVKFKEVWGDHLSAAMLFVLFKHPKHALKCLRFFSVGICLRNNNVSGPAAMLSMIKILITV